MLYYHYISGMEKKKSINDAILIVIVSEGIYRHRYKTGQHFFFFFFLLDDFTRASVQVTLAFFLGRISKSVLFFIIIANSPFDST